MYICIHPALAFQENVRHIHSVPGLNYVPSSGSLQSLCSFLSSHLKGCIKAVSSLRAGDVSFIFPFSVPRAE